MNRCCIYFGTGPKKHHYVVQLFLDWIQCVSFFPSVETHTHFPHWKNNSDDNDVDNDENNGNLIQIDFLRPVFPPQHFIPNCSSNIQLSISFVYNSNEYTCWKYSNDSLVLWNNFSFGIKLKRKKQNSKTVIHFQWKTISSN